MNIIKILVFIFSFSLLYTACSSEDTDQLGLTQRGIKTGFSQHSFPFVIEPEIIYPKDKNALNLQVGDTLLINFKVTNSSSLYPETYYKMTFEKSNPSYHQLLEYDYSFSFNDTHYVATNNDSLVLHNGNNWSRIIIKKPGNFQLHYTATDYIPTHNYGAGENIATADVNFNAVKLSAYFYRWYYDPDSDMGSHSYSHYYHKVFIETGDQKFDNFFDTFRIESVINSVIYDGGDSAVNKRSFDISAPQKRVQTGHSPTVYKTLNKLTLKKMVNGIYLEATYQNIPIINVGQHDEWTDKGREN